MSKKEESIKEGTTRTAAARREGERGAALVTTLLLSSMLLLAGSTLILTTSMTASNSFDATTELQAYYAAESGLQNAINVLRGNAAPSPLFATNPTGSVAEQNKLSFRRAVTRSYSNLASDPLKNADDSPFRLRLSRWLAYNYTPPGTAFPDRVTLSAPYSPFNGMAYSVEVVDPAYPTPAAVTTKLAADPNYEPSRLLVRATGYGPKGARKMLTAMVTNNFFEIDPPAAIVIRGADDGSSMTFDLGASADKMYSGADNAGVEGTRPSVAIKLSDWDEAQAGIHKRETINDPEVAILDIDPLPLISSLSPLPLLGNEPLSVKTPYFLKTADAARAFISVTREVAKDEGRYFSTSQTKFLSGTTDTPVFSFIDGNCELDGGAGLLVVTGDLVITGKNDFEGLIIVLGGGRVTRSGGGNGNVLGSWIVGRFNSTGGFLAPTFNVSGGGGSDFLFDSSTRNKANKASGIKTLGVVERTTNDVNSP